MNFLMKIQPQWPLRLGLGLMYFYSGSQLLSQPSLWRSFLPVWYAEFVAGIMPIETYLRLQGVTEIVMGLLFFTWFSGKWGVRIASSFLALEMAFVLIFTGVNLITFRDIGLLAAAFTLLIMSFPHASHGQNPVVD